MTWPLIQRNKVEDSKVDVPVKVCAESENEVLAEQAKKVRAYVVLWSGHESDSSCRQLLAQWDKLEYAYRIPKRLKGVSVVVTMRR